MSDYPPMAFSCQKYLQDGLSAHPAFFYKKMERPVYSDIYDFENLYQAAYETIRDKRYYPKELEFTNPS